MTQWKNIRCFGRPSRTYPLSRQQAVCDAVAACLGLEIVWYIQGEEAGDRDLWIRQIREDEIAMVARLDMITGSRAEVGGRPIHDYYRALRALEGKAGVVVEASTHARSDKRKPWDVRVEACAELVVQGRDLRPETARQMARKSHEGRKPAVVKVWADPSMAAERKRLQTIWQSRALTNDAARFLALPDDARERLGSAATARKVLGRALPGKPTRAGRPPAKKARKGRQQK